MTTYAERRERLFWSQSKHRKSKLRKKRSDNKLKRYGSNIDQRLWSSNCDDRRRAILERLSYIDTGLLCKALTACFAGSTGGSNGEGGNQEYQKKIKNLESEILKLNQIIKFLEENCNADKSVLETVSSLKLRSVNSEKDSSSKSLASKDIPSIVLTKTSKSLSNHIITSSEIPGSAKSLEDQLGSAKSLNDQGKIRSGVTLGSEKSLRDQDNLQFGAPSTSANQEIHPGSQSHTDDQLAVTEKDPCGSETHIVCCEDLYPYNAFGGFLCNEPETLQPFAIPTAPVKPKDFQPFLPPDCSCYDASEQICSEVQENSNNTAYSQIARVQEEDNANCKCSRGHYSSPFESNINVMSRNKKDDNIKVEKEEIACNIRQQIERMCCLISQKDLCSCETAIDSEIICVLKAAVDILEENWLRENKETSKYDKLLQMYQAQCSSIKTLKCQLSNVIKQRESLKKRISHNVSEGVIMSDIKAVKTTQSILSSELKKLKLMSNNLNNIVIERDALLCKMQEMESITRSKEFQLADYKNQIEKQQGIIDSLMRTLKSSKIEDSCFKNKQYSKENMQSDYNRIPSRHYSFSDTQMNINENGQINTKMLQEKLIQQQRLIEVQKECLLEQKKYICEQEEIKRCLVNKVEELLKLKIKLLKDQDQSKKLKRCSITKTSRLL